MRLQVEVAAAVAVLAGAYLLLQNHY